ncbi:ABC transporter permease [Fimbriimonas ginsengisoli]|uniref:Inner-membrane translocator n=1 Tax=Fimbriimonas ginsengisoli Gsoil 348 TaxID=661478 RepID=A0A068NQJ6_FIMGI|nr:ABC transporter permease [Fimbriimonas ginsengisoli]AIE85632.1 inner-membrane translocator [Fimbriimonas ginsengisoli Gsoil 348]
MGLRLQNRAWLPILQRYQGLVGLVLLLIVAVFVSPKASGSGTLFGSVFFSMGNLGNVMAQLAVPGLMALGATFVILTGGIDLSAGSLLGLLNCVTAMWLSKGVSGPATIAYVLLIGTVVGAILGFLIGVTKLQPFVVTLAGMVSLRGIAYVYTHSANVSGISNALDWITHPVLGVPISGWILVLFTLVGATLLKQTVFGRRTYAVGGNAEASHYAGVPVSRVRIGAYAINGFCIGLAALLFTARVRNGQPSAGLGYELDAITAAVIGGTSLLGGFGNVWGTFIGALFIVCLNVLLILKGVDYYIGQGWKGVIILVAVYLQNLGRRS